MAKKRTCGRHLTADEETNLARLLSTRKALEKKRDDVLREQKSLKDTPKKRPLPETQEGQVLVCPHGPAVSQAWCDEGKLSHAEVQWSASEENQGRSEGDFHRSKRLC